MQFSRSKCILQWSEEMTDAIGVFSDCLTSAESRISKVEDVVSSLASWEATCYWTKLSGTPTESGRPWKQKPEIKPWDSSDYPTELNQGKSLRFYTPGLCPDSGAAPPSEPDYVVMFSILFLYYYSIFYFKL